MGPELHECVKGVSKSVARINDKLTSILLSRIIGFPSCSQFISYTGWPDTIHWNWASLSTSTICTCGCKWAVNGALQFKKQQQQMLQFETKLFFFNRKTKMYFDMKNWAWNEIHIKSSLHLYYQHDKQYIPVTVRDTWIVSSPIEFRPEQIYFPLSFSFACKLSWKLLSIHFDFNKRHQQCYYMYQIKVFLFVELIWAFQCGQK